MNAKLKNPSACSFQGIFHWNFVVFCRNFTVRYAWQNHFVDWVENQWHVGFSAVPGGWPHGPHGGALTQHLPIPPTPAPSCCHLIASPLLLSVMSSCASLCFLSSIDRGWMPHHLPKTSCYVVVWDGGGIFISVEPGLAPHRINSLCESMSWYRGDYYNLKTEQNELHFGLAKLTEGSGWRWRQKKKEREWELVNSVWAGSLSPQSEHGGLSLWVPECAVKCPVEEMHGWQPRESQCDQHSHACVRGGGGVNKGIQKGGDLVRVRDLSVWMRAVGRGGNWPWWNSFTTNTYVRISHTHTGFIFSHDRTLFAQPLPVHTQSKEEGQFVKIAFCFFFSLSLSR